MRNWSHNFSKGNLKYVCKIVNNICERYKLLAKVLMINFAVYCILILLYYPRYESELDVFMQALLYGVGEEGVVSHNFFNNILVGKVMEILFSLFPTIPCYTYFHYVLVYFSLSTISYITLKRNYSVSGWIIIVFVLFFMGYEGYVLPNYLKTSVFLCISALYLILFFTTRKKKKWQLKCLAGVMLVLAFLISIRAFVISITLGIIGILVYCSTKKRMMYVLKKNMSFLMVIVAVLGIFVVVNENLYKDVKWELGREYASSVEKMYSFGYPVFTDEISSEIGVTEISYELITQGGFVGNAESQFATLKDIAKIKNDLTGENIKLFFKLVIMNYFHQGLFYCWVMMMIISLLFQKKNFKKILLISNLMIWGMSLVLYLFNAISYSWVYSLVLLPTIVYSLYNMKKIRVENIKEIVVYMFILCAIVNTLYSKTQMLSIEKKEMVVAFLEADKESTMITDLNGYWRSFSAFELYPRNLLKSYELCIFNGIYLLGGGLEKSVRIIENPEGKYTWINSDSYNSRLRNLVRQNGFSVLEKLEQECSIRK